MARLVRAGALMLVVLAGIGSLLATSPPAPFFLDIELDPNPVCAGETLRVRWDLVEGAQAPPDALRLVVAPSDATEPTIDVELAPGSGELEVVAHATGVIGAESESTTWLRTAMLEAMACDLVAWQGSVSAGVPVSLAHDPVDGSVRVVVSDGATSSLLTLTTAGALTNAPLADHVAGLAFAPSGERALVVIEPAPDGAAQTQRVLRYLDADATPVWDRAFGAVSGAPFAGGLGLAIDDGGDVVLGWSYPSERAGEPPTAAGVYVERFAPNGDDRWSFASNEGFEPLLVRVLVAGDDAYLLVARRVAAAPGEVVSLHADVIALDAVGTVRWSHREPLASPFLVDLARLGDDALLLANGATRIALGDDGQERWRETADLEPRAVTSTTAPVGEPLVATTVWLDDPWPNAGARRTGVLLERIALDGSVAWSRLLDSAADDAADVLVAWPTLDAATGVALLGSSAGSLVAPRTPGAGRDTVIAGIVAE